MIKTVTFDKNSINCADSQGTGESQMNLEVDRRFDQRRRTSVNGDL